MTLTAVIPATTASLELSRKIRHPKALKAVTSARLVIIVHLALRTQFHVLQAPISGREEAQRYLAASIVQ